MHTVWGDSSISSEGKGSSGSLDKSDGTPPQFVQRLDSFLLRIDGAEGKSKTDEQARQAPKAEVAVANLKEQLCKELELTEKKKHDDRAALVSCPEDTDESEDDDQNHRHPGVWSAGSLHHDEGQCKPCHFVSTKGGCSNGEACGFCHLAHPKSAKLKQRPCKSKRIMLKRLANTVNGKTWKNDPDKFTATVKQLVSSGEYTTSLAQAKLKRITEPELVKAMGRLDLEWVMQSSSSSKLSL
eukprot:TRINITY_DN10195_c0_g1_i3.p1 TRINITY_DN10195_c0_g1~~TRINITY_DN10195_c0_g1_i3.p1  ORF type:complete len:241 (+),score=40.31 TRINITY_DN10195_c0_g1_i3:77-799(+)